MKMVARLFEIANGESAAGDAAIQTIVGQTPRLTGHASGTATIIRVWAEDGWVHAEMEVPDEVAGVEKVQP
jgi:hypothetical protein